MKDTAITWFKRSDNAIIKGREEYLMYHNWA